MLIRKLSLAALLACAAVPALAHDYQAGNLQIRHPWSRELPPNAPAGAAYFTIENHGAADRLVGASTPRAGKSELHTHVHQDGVMKMTQVPAVELPMHGSTSFVPGGNHVMLFDLKKPLKAGEKFPLTLQFEKAGKVEVEVQVEDADYQPTGVPAMPAVQHDMSGHQGHDMGKMKHGQ